MGAITGGVSYEILFAANSSVAKARAFFLHKSYDSNNYEKIVVELFNNSRQDDDSGDVARRSNDPI